MRNKGSNSKKLDNKFSPEVLRAVASLIEKNFTGLEIKDISKLINGTGKIFDFENYREGTLLKIFNKIKNDNKKIIKIIEEFMRPLSHTGDDQKAISFVKQMGNILWHDHLIIEQDENENYVILNEGESDIFHDLKLERIEQKNPYIESEEIPIQSIDLNKNKKQSMEIKNIDVLEDKTENKKITIYINTNYLEPKDFNRGKNWGLMYKLALNQEVLYNKVFFDYFNSNKKNPLYAKYNFKVTKILKEENNSILPNIEIKITTQNKVTRQLKTA